MNEEILQDVLNNKEFMNELSKQTDIESVKQMLDKQGLNLNDDELIELQDAVQSLSKQLVNEDLEGVSGGSKGTRVAGGVTGGVLGAAAGATISGCVAAPAGAATGALLGAYFGKTKEKKAKNAVIGALVGGILSAGVTTIGGGALGAWGGVSIAKRMEK